MDDDRNFLGEFAMNYSRFSNNGVRGSYDIHKNFDCFDICVDDNIV